MEITNPYRSLEAKPLGNVHSVDCDKNYGNENWR
jgi:hypothetical protein